MPKKPTDNKKEKEKDTSATKGNASYGAKDIFVLEGLDPVRKRPGMYIGSTGTDGLHHLVWEVVDNCIDEAMAGYAQNITVELFADGSVSVVDDGRGIPVEIHPQTKKSTLETVLTTLHAGGKFGSDAYKVSGGLHGVGVSVVNALSTYLRAEVWKDGGIYEQEFKRGVPVGKVKKIGTAKTTGTRITFMPDSEIFSTIEFSEKRILEHVRQQSFLTRGIRVNFLDRRSEVPKFYGFLFEGGIISFVKHLSRDLKTLTDDIFHTIKSYDKMEVEIAFQYVDDIDARELSFANNIHTPDGGMHLTGFRTSLTRSINAYARAEGYLKEKDENLTAEDMREGLVAVTSLKLPEPQFEGQTKARLGNPNARTAVETVCNEALKEWLEKHPGEARRIVEKVLLASKARKAAKAAKDTVLRKGAMEGFTLPGKLADCSSRNAEESEMFIVEGESAGGTAKSGRDRRTQAILPLKGKILNVEKSRLDKMLANNEIRALVVAMGTAIGEEFNLEKLRYHKIVIMTDADVDGSHIRTLLLTFFYRYFRPIMEAGHFYIAMPPLFQVAAGKDIRYAFSEEEKDKHVKDILELKKSRKGKDVKEEKSPDSPEKEEEVTEEGSTKGVRIQRYKGLGEMSADQLWDTTMDPTTRTLKQVTIEDVEEADRMFNILMGDDVEPRKKFIQAHALSVQNLDI
jgi:DNA gyrase subunit B